MATALRYPKGQPFFDNNGTLLSGGSLAYFRAGTTTAQGIFSDADGLVALPNPVTLNAAGRAVDGSATPVAIYLSDDDGFDYKETISNSAGTVLYTDDDIPSPVDPGASLSDFAKPTTAWSTDTAATVNLAVGDAGTGRLASTGSNSITYNLPSAAAFINGRPITIKKTSPLNTVTLDADGSDTIDGTGTFVWQSDDRTVSIVSDGANWQILSEYGSAVGNIQVFTASGTYTPTARMKHCIVISTGGGGGGGGADSDGSSAGGGGGGGAGGTCIELFSALTIGASQPVTIGAGGSAGSDTGGNGGDGGNTDFGTAGALHFAVGGGGGAGISGTSRHLTAGGTGGTGTNGLVNLVGGSGNYGIGLTSDNGALDVALGGFGGASYWGGGPAGATTAIAAAVAGTTGTYGTGGSGAANFNTTAGAAGGAGAAGICVIFEYI